jgi:hypothetical protein
MERTVLDLDGRVAPVDQDRLALAAELVERESVLANAIRRVADAASQPSEEVVAAFNNYA